MRSLSFFFPETPDVLTQLRDQASVTLEGLQALVDWTHEDPTGSDRLRDAEHRADDHRRALRLTLRDAFMTPISQEDIYVLSERLDAVLNGAKNTVREAEVIRMPPDEWMVKMAALILAGVEQLSSAFDALAAKQRTHDGATEHADAAVKTQRELERVYRKAMSSLLESTDLREVTGRREIYRRFSRVSDDLLEVADRVWYAAVKEA
jgi:uncharacterized protein Yka (UPF0111/DUF47 family)